MINSHEKGIKRSLCSILFLLEVDPKHIYAYWEVLPEDVSALSERMADIFQQTRLTLRVYEGAGEKPSTFFDIPVEGWKNDWYIEVPRAAQAYYAQLGLKSFASDKFQVIKQSNVIETPKNVVSFHEQGQWMKVVGEYESVTMVNESGLDLTSFANRQMIEGYYANLPHKRPAKAVEQKNKEASRGEASRYEESRCDASGYEASGWSGRKEEPTGFLELSSENIFSLEMPPNRPYAPQESDFLDLSSFVLPVESPASSLSSYICSKEATVEELFRYDLDLVIYGKTQPGATLYIDENAVEIQPDGTFSCRLNLSQEGKCRIPLRAILPGGKEISVPVWIHKKSGD